jgi:Uma2 family endonuclease
MADQGSPRPIAVGPGKVRFTGSQVLAMQGAGVLPMPNRIELVDGELLDMGSEGARHSKLKALLTRCIAKALPDPLGIGPDTTLRLDDSVWLEPDLFLYPLRLEPADVRGPDALLVIEIADTSLAYDLKDKAALYASYGVREYWVIEAESGRTHVHQGPEGKGWRLVRIAEPDDKLTALFVAEVSVKIGDLI